MKKSLIAAAIAGMFVAPAAMAEVTISGAIATGVLLMDSTDGQVAGSGISKNSLASNYSNINIGSVDDLGNGMKVMFNYQLQVNINDPTPGANPHNRNSYLGIGGDWGNLKYGTNENVYERMMYSSDFMDGALGPGGNLMIMGTPGANTAFEVGQSSGCAPVAAPANIFDPVTGTGIANPDAGTFSGGCVGFYRRSDNTIWYESPNFGGFSFEVDYTLSAGKTASTDPKILSLGGRFQPEGAGWFIDAAYEKHDDMFGLTKIAGAGGTGSSDTGMQIGGGMTFGNFQVNLRLERLTYENDGVAAGGINEWERDAYWLGGKMNLPSGYAAVQFGMAEEADTNLGTATDTGANHVAVGYFHNLSKQSQLQFIYNQTSNDANATYTAAGATNGSAGADHKGLYVGIKHTF